MSDKRKKPKGQTLGKIRRRSEERIKQMNKRIAGKGYPERYADYHIRDLEDQASRVRELRTWEME